MGLAAAPSTLIHSFLTVGTILHPSCIWTYGLHMAGYAGVSGSVRLTPRNWLNQRMSRNTARNKHTNASEGPQAVQVPRSFPVPKRVPTWVSAETPQRTNQSVPCSVTRIEKIDKNARWLTRGRFYGLRHHTRQLRAPRIRTYPQGTPGRVAVHYSTMTMYQKRAQRSLPPTPSPTRSAAGIEPTLPGTRHPCTTSMLR